MLALNYHHTAAGRSEPEKLATNARTQTHARHTPRRSRRVCEQPRSSYLGCLGSLCSRRTSLSSLSLIFPPARGAAGPVQALWWGDSAGRGQQAAGCSLGCRALAPARAAAAADDAEEEEESRVRRRRMLAVMLLPWLPNSAAAEAPLSATAAPAPRSSGHPSRPSGPRCTDAYFTPEPLPGHSDGGEDGGQSRVRCRLSGKTYGAARPKCLHSALAGEELAALQRSNSSF